MKIVCSHHCGEDSELVAIGTAYVQLPKGWRSTIDGEGGLSATCPSCQLMEWHPHCRNWLRRDGMRVVMDDMPILPHIEVVKKWAKDEWLECGYVDYSVGWLDKEKMPQAWRCPACGGTRFDGVTRHHWLQGRAALALEADAAAEEADRMRAQEEADHAAVLPTTAYPEELDELSLIRELEEQLAAEGEDVR